ncbi:hypothetical protein niasHT_034281 [Heterodera trifolii]|uniref:Fido domain-containing protein n=1 Tax=Heterodera trifolii TaxID=157864 RepID=A0ABD2HR75_9BILA
MNSNRWVHLCQNLEDGEVFDLKKMNKQNLRKIWVCNNLWMDILPFFGRPQLGLKLALISPRFNALVAKHFDGKSDFSIFGKFSVNLDGHSPILWSTSTRPQTGTDFAPFQCIGGQTFNGKSVLVTGTFDILAHYEMQKKEITEKAIHLHHHILGTREANAAGVYRVCDVLVLANKATAWKDVPKEMKDFLQWANANETNEDIARFAAQVHHKLACIHPYEDGNGRMARLAMNMVLVRKGLSPIIFEETFRDKYNAVFVDNNIEPLIKEITRLVTLQL